jgi:hypothetical protein
VLACGWPEEDPEHGVRLATEAAERLAAIAGRRCVRAPRRGQPEKQLPRRDFAMEFADRSAYASYNGHPDHMRFVQERWLAEVSDFLELD